MKVVIALMNLDEEETGQKQEQNKSKASKFKLIQGHCKLIIIGKNKIK